MKNYNFGNVKQAIDKLYELDKKQGDGYVHFDITVGSSDIDKSEYVTYNIYTSSINHNRFNDKDDMIKFIDKICKNPKQYNTISLEKAKERLRESLADIEYQKEEIEQLEKGIK